MDPGTKFSGKFGPPGPNFPENFDPGLKILVLSLLAPACARHVSNQGVACIQQAARMEGCSDVEGDLVVEVYVYLVSGVYCQGKESERYGKTP